MKTATISIVFLVALALAFWGLNYYTPVMHDDIAYLFKYGPPSTVRPTDIPVNTIWDVFESQYYHYLDVNGRAPLQFLLQLFLFFGKQTFNIFNTAAFIALILMVYQLAVTKKITATQQWVVFIFITACVWFTTPFIGQTMLWLSGAVNYLWGTLIVLVFLWYLQTKSKTKTLVWWQGVGLFFGSLLAGFTQESLTLGVSAAMGVYYLFNRSKINRTTIVLVTGFWIGTLLIIISPGTFNRINTEIEVQHLNLLEHIIVKFLNLIAMFNTIKLNLMVFAALLVISMYLKLTTLQSFVKQHSLYLLIIVLTCLLFAAIGKAEPRIFFGICILLTVLTIQLLVQLLPKINLVISKTMAIGLVAILCLSFYTASNNCKDFYEAYNAMTANIKTSKNGIVAIPKLPANRFVYNTFKDIMDIHNFHVRVMGFHLKVPSITILPMDVYNVFLPINTICTEQHIDKAWSTPIYRDTNFNYIVVALDTLSSAETIKPTVVISNKIISTSHLKSYQVFIRGLFGSLPKKQETKNAFVLQIHNKLFLLIDKKNIDLNNVNKIEISNDLEGGKIILKINKNKFH